MIKINTRRRNYKKRKYMPRTIHQIARQEVKKEIKKDLEMKYWDGRIPAGTVTDSNGTVVRIVTDPVAGTTISQGPGDDQYIGTKITPKYLQFNYQVINGDAENLYTVIIFQTIGLFQPVGNAMTNVFQSTGNTSAPLSFPDRQFNDRFRILYRDTFNIQSYVPQHTRLVKLKNFRPMKFSDNAGTAENGDIYIGLISDSTATSHPGIIAQWRLYYVDA